MKHTFANGNTGQTMHAIFDGDKQITRWDPRRDKVLSSFRHSGYSKKKTYTIKMQVFVSPPRHLVAQRAEGGAV